MSISYNATDGLIISTADSTTITCTKSDGSQVNSVVISPTNVTFNVPIQISTTIPTANMIGYTVATNISSTAITLPTNSNSVVNLATISNLGPGTYLFKGIIWCKTSSSSQSNKKRTRLAMQFNDISATTIDTSGKYGGYDDFSTLFFLSAFSSAFSFSYNVQSILNIATTSNIYFNIIFNHDVTNFSVQTGNTSSYTYTRIA